MKMKALIQVLGLSLVLTLGGKAWAQQEQAPAVPKKPTREETLQKLLQDVQRSITTEGRIDKQREREFIKARNNQRNLLRKAKAELKAQERRSDRLRNQSDKNERDLARLETTLQERMGNLGEMFGVVKQVSADTSGKITDSIISAQFPGRSKFLDDLAQRKELATVPELRRMWFEMQREITESGRVVTFTAPVLNVDGIEEKGQKVTRVGLFNAVANGKYLQWNQGVGDNEGSLAVIPRQPDSRYTSTVSDLEEAKPGDITAFGIDPTHGVILSLVIQTPDLMERIKQGKEVGYVIIFLGVIGMLLTLWRAVVLWIKGNAIKSQLQNTTIDEGNALGRVMKVYADNPDTDVETLELKLDEAIIRETAPLETGLSFIKILYVVAPLLGLLGTVTGMIETFQQITLFGTGDASTMAGGISQALVTTVLGLVVAIPLTVFHGILSARAGGLIHILEERSAGIIATFAEKQDGNSV